jgi:hypothetical protein
LEPISPLARFVGERDGRLFELAANAGGDNDEW